MKSSFIMPARPSMTRSSDEISPNDLSVAICTAREPGTLKRGRKKGLKAKGTKKSQAADDKVARWVGAQRAKTSVLGPRVPTKTGGWKILRNKVRPLKKKKRVAKKKIRAVVKFKKGGKRARRRRARARLAKMLDSENLEVLAREILAAKTRLKELQDAAKSSDATSAVPSEPDAASVPLAPLPPSDEAKLSYDETWAEFRSIIYSMLRTTDPDTIPETILDTLDIKDVTNRLWKRTRHFLIKMVGDKSNPFYMLRPEATDSSVWRELLSSLEQGKVSPSEDLTFGALLNLNVLRNLKLLHATDNEAFSEYAARWEQAVWKLTKSICELWDYDPVLKATSKSDA